MNAKYVLLVIIIMAVVIGGWYYLKPGGTTTPTTGSGAQATATKAFSLVVKDRKLISGESVLTVKQGDQVSITITANESDELHLHGYDKSVEFATDTPTVLILTADQSGRFPFEMEGSKTDLGELDVEP